MGFFRTLRNIRIDKRSNESTMRRSYGISISISPSFKLLTFPSPIGTRPSSPRYHRHQHEGSGRSGTYRLKLVCKIRFHQVAPSVGPRANNQLFIPLSFSKSFKKGHVYIVGSGAKVKLFSLGPNGEEKKTQQKNWKDPKIHWFFFQFAVGRTSAATPNCIFEPKCIAEPNRIAEPVYIVEPTYVAEPKCIAELLCIAKPNHVKPNRSAEPYQAEPDAEAYQAEPMCRSVSSRTEVPKHIKPNRSTEAYEAEIKCRTTSSRTGCRSVSSRTEVPKRIKPNQIKPSRTMSTRAEPCQAEPNHVKPDRSMSSQTKSKSNYPSD
ncbi:hypothetical protein LXL04_020089 [Taraxacum kok-saghyz]